MNRSLTVTIVEVIDGKREELRKSRQVIAIKDRRGKRGKVVFHIFREDDVTKFQGTEAECMKRFEQ